MRFPYHGAGIGLVMDGRLLLGRRSERPFFGTWAVPGGGFEKGLDKDELDNARRELREETGIDLDLLDSRFICKWVLRVPFFSWTTFFYEVNSCDQTTVLDELSELEWVPVCEATEKHLRPFGAAEVRFLKRYL